jgi:glutamyl endopeptidase
MRPVKGFGSVPPGRVFTSSLTPFEGSLAMSKRKEYEESDPGEPVWSRENGGGSVAVSDAPDDEPQRDEAGDTPGSDLPGIESVPGYVALSSSETANAEESGSVADQDDAVDADWADDPEFWGALKKVAKAAVKTGRIAAKLAGSPVGTKIAMAAGSAIGVPPHITAAVTRFTKLVETRRVESGDADGGAAPSLLEVVIGADDRVLVGNTAVTPWSGICHLSITARNGARFIGTGWLISPRCVITAGHCVYIKSAGGWASKIEVSPGRDGASFPFGTVASTTLSAFPRWVSDTDRNFDCGCIILPKPPKSRTGAAPFQFRFAAKSDADIRSRALNLSGYPGDKGGITQWFHARAAQTVTPSVITYDVDTAGGQSGSPVWHLENNVRTAVGIHTNGSPLGNSATRITAAVKARLDAWRALGM